MRAQSLNIRKFPDKGSENLSKMSYLSAIYALLSQYKVQALKLKAQV